MLKAVGRHPNIVSIVGYSTRCGNRMMLLTEYCGLGSLQSFLRLVSDSIFSISLFTKSFSDEWKFRQERSAVEMRRRLNQSPAVRQLEHDTRIEEINCSMLSTLEEETETDLSHCSNPIDNLKLKNKFIFATENKSYGLQDIENIDANQEAIPDVSFHKAILKRTPKKPKRKSAKCCTISFENQEYFQQSVVDATQVVEPRQPVSYADLLDIAQQVAVGMVSLQFDSQTDC